MFRGSLVALVTPFRNGALDVKALEDLVEWHIAEGTHGLVPVGTTGESPTLTHEEHERVIEIVVRKAARRVPVIAGAGSNNTAEAIRFMQHAEKVGADAALVVTPYYNKPTQAGLIAHFRALHDCCTRRSSSTTSRPARWWTCCLRRWASWRSCRASSA